jgi:hypothetical protein
MMDENDVIELSDGDYKAMADMLPKYPPLSGDGESAVEEFFPDLSDAELEKLYAIYKEAGGEMVLRTKDTLGMEEGK